ncbi:hypothetical protein SAMN04487902_101317 [Prevotella sp. ne3005]|nr:hypothetical protein SAMN04487902_101317 [Prevotella sp. ne3005]
MSFSEKQPIFDQIFGAKVNKFFVKMTRVCRIIPNFAGGMEADTL